MPRGDKSAYTGKQQRKAEHIEEGYEERGVPPREAERRAWATVNKQDGGGKRAGAARGAKRGSPRRRASTTRSRSASSTRAKGRAKAGSGGGGRSSRKR